MVALSPHELRFVLVRVELSRRDVVHLRLSELTVDKSAQTILTELTARFIQTIPLLMDYSISKTFHLSIFHAIITTSIMQLYISCQNTCIHTAMQTIIQVRACLGRIQSHREYILFIGLCTPCTFLYHRSKMIHTLNSLHD